MKANLIINDTNGYLLGQLRNHLKQNGYHIHILNLYNPEMSAKEKAYLHYGVAEYTPQKYYSSINYNPLLLITKLFLSHHVNDAEKLLSYLATLLYNPYKQGLNKTFYNNASLMFQSIVTDLVAKTEIKYYDVFSKYYQSKHIANLVTFNRVVKLVTGLKNVVNPFIHYIKDLHKQVLNCSGLAQTLTQRAIDLYNHRRIKNEMMFGAVYSTFLNGIRLYSGYSLVAHYANLTSSSSYSFNQLLNNKYPVAIFVIGSGDEGVNTLATSLIDQISYYSLHHNLKRPLTYVMNHLETLPAVHNKSYLLKSLKKSSKVNVIMGVVDKLTLINHYSKSISSAFLKRCSYPSIFHSKLRSYLSMKDLLSSIKLLPSSTKPTSYLHVLSSMSRFKPNLFYEYINKSYNTINKNEYSYSL